MPGSIHAVTWDTEVQPQPGPVAAACSLHRCSEGRTVDHFQCSRLEWGQEYATMEHGQGGELGGGGQAGGKVLKSPHTICPPLPAPLQQWGYELKDDPPSK